MDSEKFEEQGKADEKAEFTRTVNEHFEEALTKLFIFVEFMQRYLIRLQRSVQRMHQSPSTHHTHHRLPV